MCCFYLKISCKGSLVFLFSSSLTKYVCPIAYTMIDMVERIKINSKILFPNTTISLIFDRNSWVFAVRIQRFMKNERESPSNLIENGYIRILNLEFCIVASMKMMVVMISDDETIMKGEHTHDAGIILEVCGPSLWFSYFF
jgi:hypothetical protein